MIGALGFCGMVILGLAVWNFHLSLEGDELEEQNRRLTEEVERLLDDVTKLAAESPRRDSQGRFRKKAKA
jgi:hypothetical protein